MLPFCRKLCYGDFMLEQRYDLTCWYIHVKRVAELFGSESINSPNVPADNHLFLPLLYSRIKDMVVAKILETPPPAFEELLLSGRAQPGTLFTHTGKFFCKGLSKYLMAQEAGKKLPALPSIYTKLNQVSSVERLEVVYQPEHLTSSSASVHLQGGPSLFLLGVIDSVHEKVIQAKPFIIGSIMMNIFSLQAPIKWGDRFEVTAFEIDSFNKIQAQYKPKLEDLEILKPLSEDTIKHVFAEIIGEPIVPKDRGGERSDLFSNRVLLEGRRISTAFIFKGPAKFHPMTLTDLGKNGDQIGRLFSEPANLLILQHCHAVVPAVREAMQAYAQNIGNPRRWCVIDGFDTLRILRAYRPHLVGKMVHGS